ncbi:hypothetical protein GN956_G3055 [Arapaima gigas]
MTVLPPWSLSLPLPAVLLITLCLYLLLLVGVLWCHHCLLARCSPQCGSCWVTDTAMCERCLLCAEACDCHLPSLRSCLDHTCPPPSCPSPPQCAMWDCACTCQPPECNSINCLCFEIKFR